jgi:hypothetical protein
MAGIPGSESDERKHQSTQKKSENENLTDSKDAESLNGDGKLYSVSLRSLFSKVMHSLFSIS